jgi:hypothetical protein
VNDLTARAVLAEGTGFILIRSARRFWSLAGYKTSLASEEKGRKLVLIPVVVRSAPD